MSTAVLVEGAFDDLQARDLERLEEAAKGGPVTVRLLSGGVPKFSLAERAYVLSAVRGVARVIGEDGNAFAREPDRPPPPDKIVAVTGCFDWLHSGHVRFFAQAAQFGALHVFLGNDACIRELKGARNPHFPAKVRAYCVGRLKDVARAQVSTGMGLLDADAEIRALKPDVFVVNDDGDKGGKREWCESLGIEYRVLRRLPAEGLPARSSTELRGF